MLQRIDSFVGTISERKDPRPRSTMVADPNVSYSPACESCAVITYTRTMPDPHYQTRKELFWTIYNQIQSSTANYTSRRLTPAQSSSLSVGTELAQFQATLHDYRLLDSLNRLPTRREPTVSEIESAHALRVAMVYDVSDDTPTLVITW